MIDYAKLSLDERNRLIHTKVMNASFSCTGTLQYATGNRREGSIWYWTCIECGASVPVEVAQPSPIEHSRNIPNYCEDMNAAMLIVEKLYAQYDICIRIIQGEVQQKYFVQLYDRTSHETQDGVQSDVSMQDAIALAALEVKDEEVQS